LTKVGLRHADRWVGREIELLRHLDEESAKYAAARQAGDFELAAVIAGESAGLIHGVPPAREIIERIVRQASAPVGWLSPQAA
jgi:nitronate monooxygenase